jgi:hypothetical protein
MPRPLLALAIALASSSCDGGGGTADPDGGGPPGDGAPPGDGCPGGQITDGVGEPAALAGITRAHNVVRAMTSPCTPLPPLQWDPQLAATAAAWVAMCRDQDAPAGLIDHNPNRSQGAPYYVGENVFGAGGAPGAGTAQQAVKLWADEGAKYNYANNTCNGVCGHYTQIVWRDTRKIGCAIGDCPNLQFRTSLVCDYGPGGNIGGQRPY